MPANLRKRFSCSSAAVAIGAVALVSLYWMGLWLPAFAESGWQVVQTGDSCPMGPGTTLTVTGNAMRVAGARGRIVMITSGPSWNVVLFNNQAHVMYQTTLANWMQSAQQEKSHRSLEGATWKRGSTDQIARMRAYAFIMDHPPTRVNNANGKHNVVTSAQLWVAQDIATSAAISNVFSKLYGIPDCQRLPLRLATATGGAPSVRLDTISVAPVSVSSSAFQVPSGYKSVSSYVDVITGNSDTEELKKLLDQ
jgi:hypothetical protein